MRRGWLEVLGAAALALAGCVGADPEPADAMQPLPQAQVYPFLTVWECCLEASEREGFPVARSQRDGERGEWTTEFQVTFRDAVERRDRSHRLHGRVAPAGEGQYTVHLAASAFVADEGGDWSYVGPDPELRARFERALHASLGRRYQGPR
jgi:hypothetical protein